MMCDTYAVRETAQTNEIKANAREIVPIADYICAIHNNIEDTYAILSDVYKNYVGDRANAPEPKIPVGNSMSDAMEQMCGQSERMRETATRLASIFGRAGRAER